MSVTTKLGDQGFTDLKGKRVSKSDDVVKVLGAFDTTMALIMLADNYCPIENVEEIVHNLSCLAGVVSGYIDSFDYQKEIKTLEDFICHNENEKFSFVYPFKQEGKLWVNYARTQVRSLEQLLWKVQCLPSEYIGYVNRLSDYLYVIFTKM